MNPDAAGSSYEGSEPYEQKVGYGRHATHRLSLSRETQVGPRGLKRFRARVENLFLQNESFGGPPTLRRGSVTRGSVDSKNISISLDRSRSYWEMLAWTAGLSSLIVED